MSFMRHVSLGTNDLDAAVAFYDVVLATLGGRRALFFAGQAASYVSERSADQSLWLHAPHDGEPATVGNGSHIGFAAGSREQVDAFFAAAVANGGVADGAPGARALYGAAYYGGFVRDLDGNKIEAYFIDPALRED